MGTKLPHVKGHSSLCTFRPTLLWHDRPSQQLPSSCNTYGPTPGHSIQCAMRRATKTFGNLNKWLILRQFYALLRRGQYRAAAVTRLACVYLIRVYIIDYFIVHHHSGWGCRLQLLHPATNLSRRSQRQNCAEFYCSVSRWRSSATVGTLTCDQ